MSTTIYRPGEIVTISGIYNVVDRYAMYLGYQRTCVRDEPFPPLEAPAYGFMLHEATIH